MAVQVSYPGVYSEEFTPGAPIEGVSTSTAAFIGTAQRGPIKQPRLIQSWEGFGQVFGGFITEPPVSYLAPAVYGFFLNGGTSCYILRAGTGKMAAAGLDSDQSQDPILIVRAHEEGYAGNGITVQVDRTSRLKAILSGIGATPNDVLRVFRKETSASGVSANRTELTVTDNVGFAPDDRLLLTKADPGGGTAEVIVRSTSGTDKVLLASPIPGPVDFGTGTVAAKTADLFQGQRRIRLEIPQNLQLNQALPRGTAVRIQLGAALSEVRIVESSGGDTITFRDGLANSYSLQNQTNRPTIASLEFDLIVNGPSLAQPEEYRYLSMHPDHPNYWASLVTSTIVALDEPSSPPNPTPTDMRPVAGSYNLSGGAADERAMASAQLKQDPKSYLDLFKPHDDISLVAIPGETDQVVQRSLIDHCEKTGDRFAILDAIKGTEPANGIRTQFESVRSEKGFAALYYPWITARSPTTGKNESWPPSGHIAGVYARIDASVGVHKAPANAAIEGALGLERLLTDQEQGPLNLMGINVLRVFRGQSQPVVWGARTTAGDLNRNWQYVNVRRLFLYIEESIEEGIRGSVFAPNNLQLWQKLKRTITEFLARVWRDGALFGKTAEEAFFVRIDEALNPPSTQALGRLYIEIGIRPTYPAEFIIVRIGIWQGGSEVNEA